MKRNGLFFDIIGGNGGVIDVKPTKVGILSDERKRNIKEKITNPCSHQQIRYYEDNWEQILRDDIMIPHLKKGVKTKTSSVLHGGKSMNIILADDNPNSKYYRESQDYDIFSFGEPEHISRSLEKKLDQRIGCNICETKKVPIPKVIQMTRGKTVSSQLFRIETPHTEKDPSSIIDVMDLPEEVSVIRHKGKYGTLRHESLMDAYLKTKSGILHPIRSFKSSAQKQILQSYLRDTYGRTMLIEDDPETLVFSKRDTTKQQMVKNQKRLAFPRAYHIVETPYNFEYRFSYEDYDKYYHRGGQAKHNTTKRKTVKKTVPKIIIDGGKRFTLHSQFASKQKLESSSRMLKRSGYLVKNRFVKINGKKTYLVYTKKS